MVKRYNNMKTLITLLLITLAFSVNAQTTKQDRALWNGFVDFLQAKGLKGSTILDNKSSGLSERLFTEYAGKGVDCRAFVTKVQTSIANYRANALKQIHSGKAAFNGPDSSFMPGLSVVDGWAGSRTTTYKFPADSIPVYEAGKLINHKPNNTNHD